MPSPPARPTIYHITHVENLPSIVAGGALFSDAAMIARGGPAVPIGMSGIKQRRLSRPMLCHPGDCVGDYVPFYFCPRSIMLYVISRRNHQDMTYTDGQDDIIHLEADLNAVIAWAEDEGRKWAFTLSNAGAVYARFRSSPDDLGQINWAAVAARDWRAPEIREGKQAEFLVHGSFPWELVECIGVRSASVKAQVDGVLRIAQHRPKIRIQPDWYY